MSGSFSQFGGGCEAAEPEPPAPDPDGWVPVLELGLEWSLVADPEGQPHLRDPAGSRIPLEYEPAPGAGWVERLQRWTERYDTLRVPLHLRPVPSRKRAARLALLYWTRPERRFRVVHLCGCEERYTLPEGEDGRRQVERLRAQPCGRCSEW